MSLLGLPTTTSLRDMVHASAGHLYPITPSVGVYPGQAHDYAITLILREKILTFSGDEFAIADTGGQAVLHCKGSVFSIHDRKKVTDTDGVMLFNISDQILSFGKSYVVRDNLGRKVLRVKKRFILGSKLAATFINSAGQDTELTVQGDFWGGSANIRLSDGRKVAHIGRSLLGRDGDVVFDDQTYALSIAPGVDIALMATLCILFDEVKRNDPTVRVAGMFAQHVL